MMAVVLLRRDRFLRTALSILPLALVFTTSACGQETAPPRQQPAARSQVPQSQAGLTTITGKAPRGAVVAFERDGAEPAAPPTTPAVMDQRGQQFIPGLLIAQAGQPVEFRNSEGINHNVYVTRNPSGTAVINVSTDPGQSYTHAFDAGQFEVSCDIHPSMRASLVIVATPYIAVADDFGAFLVTNVPPGGYRMVVSYAGTATERTVDVKGPHVDVGAAAGT
jgi:plastocyanin